MVTAQEQQEAGNKVAKLCQEAVAVLVDAEEGPMEQAKLLRIEDKAYVQVGLWSTK